MKVQQQWSNVSGITRKQLKEHAPALNPILERYDGATAGEILQSIDSRPTSTVATKVARGAGAVAVVGGLMATASGIVRAFNGSPGLGLVGIGLSVAGLGALSTWGGNTLEDSLSQRNQATHNALVEGAESAAGALVSSADGKISDRLFFDLGAFSNPVEVRQAGSGQVLSRQVSIQGPVPTVLKEDATKNEVTVQWAGGESSFAGHLELPTAERRVATVVHEAGGDDPEKLQDTLLEFGPTGEVRLAAASKHYWDEEGFGYDDIVYLGQNDLHLHTQLNEDGSAYFNGLWDQGWYALQAPTGLLSQPMTGNSREVTMPSRRSDELELTYAVSHGELQGVALQPLELSERPVGATLKNVAVRAENGQVEARHGAEVRRFAGSLDSNGVVTVETPAGKVSQELADSRVSLTLSHPQGDFHVTHSSLESVHVWQSGDHRRAPSAAVTPEGNYQVTWDGGTLTVEAPVPYAWL